MCFSLIRVKQDENINVFQFDNAGILRAPSPPLLFYFDGEGEERIKEKVTQVRHPLNKMS